MSERINISLFCLFYLEDFKETITRLGLKFSLWEGASASVHMTLTSGAFLTGYALLLGANDFELSLLLALLMLMQSMQLPRAYFSNVPDIGKP
ncbi:MAG: hypothetical protein P8O70_15360 [SAR324 cluster bacterium]|nr:hypothetical protein [SAR324 cluster bacterium]